MKGLIRKILSESKTQKLNNKKGMTYVELLCALSLLVLIVVMFSPMLLSSYESLYTAGEKTHTVYGGKKEIEKGLTFRGQHDDLAEGMEVNFKTFSTVVLIKAKQVVTSMEGLETLYSDEKGKVTMPAELTMADNQDSQILKIKFTNSSFTQADFDNGKIFITNGIPSASQLNGGKMAYQFKSAFNDSKDLSKDAEFVKMPNMDTEDEENYDPTLHVLIKGIDITDSPIKVSLYYLSGNQVKCSETHYYISPADLMFVGDTGTADYFTSAGVDESGNMLVAARTFQDSSMRVTSGLNDVKWISESNDSSIADGYYMMCGENSVVRRLWHFTPGVVNIGTRRNDFTSLLGMQEHYVFGGDVAYPYEWAGDYTDTYSMSVNTTDSVYEDAPHNYSLNGSNLSYGYNGYTVNASSLSGGVWAPSEIAARNLRISYVMTGNDKDAARSFGATEDEVNNGTYTKYLYQDGYITRYSKRDGSIFNKYEHFTNGYAGDHNTNQEHLYCSDDGYWYRRKGSGDFVKNSNYKGYNTWFDNEGGDNDNSRRVPIEYSFQGRKWVPNGTNWGENEEADTPNATDIACLVLKSYNNYDRTHLANNAYQNASTSKKVSLTSCAVLPGKGGESLCLGTTQAYALINETTAKDPEFLRPGYMNSYKIESVGNTTYAKKYSHLDSDSEFNQVRAALKDYENMDVDNDKTRQLANDGKAASDGAFETYADTYFTMGYSSQLSAVYDKFINDNSSHQEKPLESIYLLSKNTNAADDGYHNMWLTREFYNLTVSDTYNKSVVAAGYNVAGAAKTGYIKRVLAPYKPDVKEARIAPMYNLGTDDGKLEIPDPAVNPAGMWSKSSGDDAKNGNFWALTFRDLYGYSQDNGKCVDDFWVQLPASTIGYTEFDRITNDAVLSVYTEGVKTFAPILYYKEPDGSSVRFNSVSVSALNDKRVGIAAGTSNGKIFILYPDYVNGVISSSPIVMGIDDNGQYNTVGVNYQVYDMNNPDNNPSMNSIDAVKVFSTTVDGTPKFCLIMAGNSVSDSHPTIGVATFDTQTGALDKYTEFGPTAKGDANIKDICVANGVVYAVGSKVSSGVETKNGVIYSCSLDELLHCTQENNATGVNWGAVDTCATEVKASNGEIVAKSTSTLPALKAVASNVEID